MYFFEKTLPFRANPNTYGVKRTEPFLNTFRPSPTYKIFFGPRWEAVKQWKRTHKKPTKQLYPTEWLRNTIFWAMKAASLTGLLRTPMPTDRERPRLLMQFTTSQPTDRHLTSWWHSAIISVSLPATCKTSSMISWRVHKRIFHRQSLKLFKARPCNSDGAIEAALRRGFARLCPSKI